jgi:hypothetical protein
MATTMGMSTSKSRISLSPKTSAPPSSKVTENSAHGAKMDPRTHNKPDGWAAGYGGGNTAGSMCSEEYGKSGQKQTMPSLSFNPKDKIPRKL